jgi:hypothetical protein
MATPGHTAEVAAAAAAAVLLWQVVDGAALGLGCMAHALTLSHC